MKWFKWVKQLLKLKRKTSHPIKTKISGEEKKKKVFLYIVKIIDLIHEYEIS